MMFILFTLYGTAHVNSYFSMTSLDGVMFAFDTPRVNTKDYKRTFWD